MQQNSVKFKVAHIRRKGIDLIIIPLDPSFQTKSKEEMSEVFRSLQRYAGQAGLEGAAVLVWDTGDNKTGIFADTQVLPHCRDLTLSWVQTKINRELTVKSLIAGSLPLPKSGDSPMTLDSGTKPGAGVVPVTSDSVGWKHKASYDRRKGDELKRKSRSGLVTLLFTDIVGSTKLKQALGDKIAITRIQEHHRLMRDILGRCQGEEISTAGDSFFAVFDKPSDAVRFSLLLQARQRQIARLSDHPIYDRIGVHVGEVFIEESTGAGKLKDLFGIQVDTCARVMALAEADQILMTRFVFDNARQVLMGQEIEGVGPLTWVIHGLYPLKGVEGPFEICEVGESGLAALTAPEDPG